MESALHESGVFALFGVFSLFGAVFMYFFIHETNGLSEKEKKEVYKPGTLPPYRTKKIKVVESAETDD